MSLARVEEKVEEKEKEKEKEKEDDKKGSRRFELKKRKSIGSLFNVVSVGGSTAGAGVGAGGKESEDNKDEEAGGEEKERKRATLEVEVTKKKMKSEENMRVSQSLSPSTTSSSSSSVSSTSTSSSSSSSFLPPILSSRRQSQKSILNSLKSDSPSLVSSTPPSPKKKKKKDKDKDKTKDREKSKRSFRSLSSLMKARASVPLPVSETSNYILLRFEIFVLFLVSPLIHFFLSLINSLFFTLTHAHTLTHSQTHTLTHSHTHTRCSEGECLFSWEGEGEGEGEADVATLTKRLIQRLSRSPSSTLTKLDRSFPLHPVFLSLLYFISECSRSSFALFFAPVACRLPASSLSLAPLMPADASSYPTQLVCQEMQMILRTKFSPKQRDLFLHVVSFSFHLSSLDFGSHSLLSLSTSLAPCLFRQPKQPPVPCAESQFIQFFSVAVSHYECISRISADPDPSLPSITPREWFCLKTSAKMMNSAATDRPKSMTFNTHALTLSLSLVQPSTQTGEKKKVTTPRPVSELVKANGGEGGGRRGQNSEGVQGGRGRGGDGVEAVAGAAMQVSRACVLACLLF